MCSQKNELCKDIPSIKSRFLLGMFNGLKRQYYKLYFYEYVKWSQNQENMIGKY